MNLMLSSSTLLGLLALVLLAFVPARPALAVRPFVTDDARVVGYHVGQFEGSVKADKNVVANLNLFAFGPTENLELTAGWVDGFPHGRGEPRVFSVQGPLLQAKYLFFAVKPNATPGLAAVVGGFPPWGSQTFKPDASREFFYIAMTESLGDADRVLDPWEPGSYLHEFSHRSLLGDRYAGAGEGRLECYFRSLPE